MNSDRALAAAKAVPGCAVVLISTIACITVAAAMGVAALWPSPPLLEPLPPPPAAVAQFYGVADAGMYGAEVYVLAADENDYAYYYYEGSQQGTWRSSEGPSADLEQEPCQLKTRKHIERQVGAVSVCYTAHPQGEFAITSDISFALDQNSNIWTLREGSISLILAIPAAVVAAPIGLAIGVLIVVVRHYKTRASNNEPMYWFRAVAPGRGVTRGVQQCLTG
jgi:hypothetical protein